MEKIVGLMKKYKSVILYLVFGAGTTLVNIAAYYLSARMMEIPTVPSNCIAWFLSVLFAYITNRKWVFESKASGKKEIFREICSFFSCRLFTGALDMGIMYLFVDVLGFNDMIIKIVSNVTVIVLNYILSKLVIFRKK